jgi:hypothetical protein
MSIEHFSAHGSKEGTRVPAKAIAEVIANFPFTLFLAGGQEVLCDPINNARQFFPYGGAAVFWRRPTRRRPQV